MLAYCSAVSRNAAWNAESGESWEHVLHRNVDAPRKWTFWGLVCSA